MSSIIFISQKAFLRYRNNNLIISVDEVDNAVCLDDINIIIVENPQTTITASAVVNISSKNISLVFSDKYYIPSAISYKLYKHSKSSNVQKHQIEISKPFKNRLWKEIIVSKLKNQSFNLERNFNDTRLTSLAKRVTSGDKGNLEAIGASYYFRVMYSPSFVRRNDEDVRNMCLNYGYSILRSSILRHIVAYGLNPSFGIWHSNEFNPHNLADDFIEPFRPLVDRYVYHKIKKDGIFSIEHRKSLSLITQERVLSWEGNLVSVDEAIRDLISSYQSVCFRKTKKLKLFSLV